MGTRRDFLQLGIAASALPFAEAARLSMSTIPAAPSRMPFYKVVFDERFPDSVTFARQMQKLGATVHGITGDITDFWYHELHHRWTNAPVAVAGLTAYGPLFCLERLAWDHRMRVVYRAEHRLRPDGRIEHAFAGPESMLRHAMDLVGGGPDWGAHVANIVGRCPHACAQMTETTIVASLPNASVREGAGDVDAEPLISWVIAPLVRV